MLPKQLVRDSLGWPCRVKRLAACALERARSPQWGRQIARSERWADGGRPARNSAGSRLACMDQACGNAMLEAAWGMPFRCLWLVLADLLGPLELPILGTGWRGWDRGRVVAMAEEIYTDRAWGSCGILADALDDAGVPDGELQRHLRSGRPHHPGCWALDFLTGRLTRPRRGRLLRLPELERPVVYEVLLATELAPEMPPLSPSIDPQEFVRELPLWLAREKATPLERRATPRMAYQAFTDMHWHGEYTLSVFDNHYALEREVPA